MQAPTLPAPLNGVRVLEMTNYIAGPYSGMILADLGADVIKVENPSGGDFSRNTRPFVKGESAGFMTINRNKRSVSLNLKDPQGRDLFLRLAQTADVIIENFRPGTTQDLGVDYDSIRKLKPDIIYASVSAYGQTGPYSQRAGLDLILQGMSGLMSITGEPDRPPVKVGVPVADLTAALYAANAIQAAYIVRLKTGGGQYIDVSLFEAAVALEVWETSGYFATGEVAGPIGSAHRVSAPYQAFRTSDGHVTMGATSPGNWARFCEVMGLGPLEHDPRFATNAQRKGNEAELAEIIERVTLTNTSDHWYRKLEEAGVPCGILQRIDQVAADQHLLARDFVVDLPHPSLGALRVTASPMHLSTTPVRMKRAGPLLGEHNLEVFGELGLSPETLAALEAEGVLGKPPVEVAAAAPQGDGSR